jgi:hypothetical protein
MRNVAYGLILFFAPVFTFGLILESVSRGAGANKYGSASFVEGYEEAKIGTNMNVLKWTLDKNYRVGRLAGRTTNSRE